MIDKEQLEAGKIYYIKYSANTELVGRFKEKDTMNLFFFDYLHYWNGFENFHYNNTPHCVTSGIEELREATQTEKMSLVRFEIENHCI